MIEKMKFQNYIPTILTMFFSSLLVGLLALGHSRYALLGEMSLINNPTLDQQLADIITILEIVVLVGIFAIALLQLFTIHLYSMHLFCIGNIFLALIVLIFESIYVGISFNETVLVDGVNENIFYPLNWLTFICAFLWFIAVLLTFIFFVNKPYLAIQKEIKERDENEKKKQDDFKNELHSKIASMNKEELLTFIQKEKDAGNISEEDYLSLLKELTTQPK